LNASVKGRREERARLRGFAAGGKGMLMVYGAPGIGKSALLAQVVREIEAGVDADGRKLKGPDGEPVDPPPTVEYFIRRSEGRDDPARFLRYLCRRLDGRYGLEGQGLGSEPVELQEQLSARLAAIEEESGDDRPKRTVLLIDGLDEAPELGRYVPEARPWLPVMVASRETPEANTFYEARRRETRSAMTVGPLGKKEVRAILYEGANKYDPAFDEDYVDAVAERSEGNPLYLTLLAEELFQGKLEVGDIDALPEKIGELYGEAVRRVTDEGKNQTALDLLHLLTEAKAPLTEEAIGELLEVNPMQASAATRAAMELLHEAAPEALYPTGETPPDEAVQLFHESLREWLREQHSAACREMQERLAEKTAAWGSRENGTARRYALRYGAVHQQAAGRHDELYDLLTGESYKETQVRAFKQYEATYAAYEAGLETYVDRNGETPEDDARLCRLALDAGQVAREAKEGVTQAFRWAEEGRMEDALQRISVLDEEKYFLAALRLIWIEADRQSERPEEERSPEKAQKVLDAVEERIAPGTEAIDWSDFIDEDFMAWWAGHILTILPEIDVMDLLLRTSNPGELSEALANRIETRADDVDLRVLVQAALEAVRSIDRDYGRHKPLAVLASALTDAGETKQAESILEQALDVAQTISSNSLLAEALSHMGSVVAESDGMEKATPLFERALKAAEWSSNDKLRAKAFSEIADALAATENLKKARSVLRKALTIAQSIENSPLKAKRLCRIAKISVYTGNPHQAYSIFRETLSVIESTNSKPLREVELLSKLAYNLSSSTDFSQHTALLEETFNLAQSVENADYRATALTCIAGAFARIDEIEQARSILADVPDSEASFIVGAFGRPSDNGTPPIVTAQTLASVGKLELALNIIQMIGSGKSRDRARNHVATVTANVLSPEQALEVAQSTETEEYRTKGLTSVICACADTWDFSRLRSAFEKLFATPASYGLNSHRSYFIVNITRDLAQNGNLEQAQEVFSAAEFRDNSNQLTRLAQYLADSISFDRSRSLYDKIIASAWSVDDDNRRALVLTGIAKALARSGEVEQVRPLLNDVLEIAAQLRYKSELYTWHFEQTIPKTLRLLAQTADLENQYPTFEKALSTARSIDDRSLKAEALSETASAIARTGSTEKARSVFEESLTIAQTAFNRAQLVANIVSSLVEVASHEKASRRAKSIFERAFEVAQTIESDEYRAMALSSIAPVLSSTGEIVQTQPLFEEILGAVRAIGRNRHRAEALSEIACVFSKIHGGEEAQSIFKEALVSARAIDSRSSRGRTLAEVASALSEAEGPKQASPLFTEALSDAHSIDNNTLRAETFTGIASALLDAGSQKKARSAFEKAISAAQLIESAGHTSENVETVIEETFLELIGALTALENPAHTDSLLKQIFLAALSIPDLSTRSSIVEKIAEKRAKEGQTEAFARHLPQIELFDDGWTDVLSTWRGALLEHSDDPRPLLRQSFLLYPFDTETAAEGAYSLVQAHVQAGAMDHAEAIARECPELELDVLMREHDSGRDPDDLPEDLREQYDKLADLRETGMLDEEEFDEKAGALFERADL